MARILHLGWSFSPHVSRWLYAQRERGHDVHLISYGGEALSDIATHLIPRSSLGRIGYLTAIGQVRRISERINPDLIHAHYAAGFGLWGAALKRYPLVVSCWGTDIVGSANSFLLRRVVGYALESADRVIVTSNFLREQLEAFPANLQSKPALIRFGMDLHQTEALFVKHTTENQTNKSLRLLFFKHHRTEYGPHVALESLAKVRSSGADVRLTLAGRGPDTAQLKALAESLGVSDVVDFPGYVAAERALDYIAEFDVMLMPTIIPESFGVAALEAAALGLPVVASDVGGVSEIVRHELNGLLVPPDDSHALGEAILRLYNDPITRRKYSQAARKLVTQEFDWETQVALMEALYSEFL